MRKSLLMLTALVALPLALFAAERIVVLEIFTGTWCGYCPGAAMGAEDLVNAYSGQVMVVEYHGGSSDPFVNTNGTIRKNFYGPVMRGYPTAIFDGVDTLIGGFADKSLFPWYEPIFNTRRSVEPPLEITLDKSGASEGTLTATIENTSDDEITGMVHFTITESNIPYAWRNQFFVHFVERDMLPDANGAEITLAAGADTTITRDYVIDPEWIYYTNDLGNIEFGCFVQDTTSMGYLREILQAAMISLTNELLEGVEEEAVSLPLSLNATTLVKGYGFVELSLDAPADVEISLYDCLGRKLETLHRGVLEAGNHRIEIKADALPAGTYFIKATAGVHNQVSKLVILD